MAYDEYYTENLSQMVNRVRFEEGDPRYFLAELKNNSHSNILKGQGKKVVILHRLPHMRMSKKTISKINKSLFLFMILICCTWPYTRVVFELFSNF